MPQYKHRIEKIKTIGSTYMAAAGLHPGRASTEGGVRPLFTIKTFSIRNLQT